MVLKTVSFLGLRGPLVLPLISSPSPSPPPPIRHPSHPYYPYHPRHPVTLSPLTPLPGSSFNPAELFGTNCSCLMSFAFSFQKITQDGERAEAEKDLLPPPHVQVAQAVQSDPVQEVGRVEVCPGKEEV